MCWSQTYNRAANMISGPWNALNQFKEITGNQKAIYYHCASNEKKIWFMQSIHGSKDIQHDWCFAVT